MTILNTTSTQLPFRPMTLSYVPNALDLLLFQSLVLQYSRIHSRIITFHLQRSLRCHGIQHEVIVAVRAVLVAVEDLRQYMYRKPLLHHSTASQTLRAPSFTLLRTCVHAFLLSCCTTTLPSYSTPSYAITLPTNTRIGYDLRLLEPLHILPECFPTLLANERHFETLQQRVVLRLGVAFGAVEPFAAAG